MSEINYKKFRNRVCDFREAGFIGIGFVIAIVVVAAVLLGIYFGVGDQTCQPVEGVAYTSCGDGTCQPAEKWCDGQMDCPLGQDEWKCFPNHFYVSFRTDNPFEQLLSDNSSAEFSNRRDEYQAKITGALKKGLNESHPFLASHIVSVEVFRFRPVNALGQNVSDEGETLLAVDSFVMFNASRNPISIIVNTTGAYNNTEDNTHAKPETIMNAITTGGFGAQFGEKGNNVTTGVGVVLRSPEGTKCRRKFVYCNVYCISGYRYGNTKGCPEWPCACVK